MELNNTGQLNNTKKQKAVAVPGSPNLVSDKLAYPASLYDLMLEHANVTGENLL